MQHLKNIKRSKTEMSYTFSTCLHNWIYFGAINWHYIHPSILTKNSKAIINYKLYKSGKTPRKKLK